MIDKGLYKKGRVGLKGGADASQFGVPADLQQTVNVGAGSATLGDTPLTTLNRPPTVRDNQNDDTPFVPPTKKKKKKTVDNVVNTDGPKPNPLKNLLSFLNPLSYFQMLNNPETRKRLTGYETQAEYEQARQDRINLNRIKTIENTLARKYSDGDYSQTDLDERLAALKSQMGITPNTAAQNEQQFLDFSNDPELAFEGIKSISTGRTDYTDLQELYDRDKLLSGMNTFVPSSAQTGLMSLNPNAGIQFAGTVLEDEFTPALKNTGFIEVQDTPQSKDDFFLNAVAELTDKQKRFINSKKFPLQENLITPQSVFDTITDPDLGIYDTGTFGFGAQEPTTEEEYNDYLRSLGLTQTI